MDVAFITFLVIQQALNFGGSAPVLLLFTGWNRVNLLHRHQFHTTDIKSGNESETLH